MKRGVVSAPGEIISLPDGNGFRTGKNINEIDINYFTLYWDKLVFPTNNLIHIGIPKERELIECGVLQRPKFVVDGMHSRDYLKFYVDSQIKTVDILRNQSKDVDWSLHFTGGEVSLPKEHAEISQAVRVELFGLLPVPTADTHLHDILEFKQRRSAELEALHSHLDGLYLEVMSSGDINLQKTKALSGLMSAISDIDKLNNEGWRSPIKFDISTSFEFDLTQVYAAATTAVIASQQLSTLMTLGVSTLAYLAGGIKIKPVMQSLRNGGDKNLSYLAQAHSERIIGN
ncbi:DUF6236 family protein [Serratia fonticola]